MVKIPLLQNDYSIDILTTKSSKKVEIKKGVYNGKEYHTLIINDSSIFVEGDNNANYLIASDTVAIYITSKRLLERIAEILKDESICITNTIPEGKEKEILQKLLEA
jgi:hypothetical protein